MSDPGASPDDTDSSAGADASASQPTVLCTIMNNGDGSFTLVDGSSGDESDDDDASASGADADGGDGVVADGGAAGDDAAGSGEGAEGMPPAAGGVAAAPKGQTFDSEGPLLKAVLDLVKEAQTSGEGSAEDQFSAGFNGDKSSTPKS